MLAPWVIQQFPPHRVYVEPFGGAASVLMRKPRSAAEVYNDADGDVVNLFRVLRDDCGPLFRALRRTPYSRAELDAAFERSEDRIERARRLVVRACMGFGTNNLVHRKGFRAYTGAKRSSLPVDDFASYPRAVAAFSRRLRDVVIEHDEAVAVMLRHDSPETLHYCDPPYVHSTRRVIAESHVGYAHELTNAEHERLAETLHRLRGAVLISGYPSPLYERLYSGWHQVSRPAFADGGQRRTEVLWMNAAAVSGRGGMVDLFSTSGAKR